MDLIAMFLLCRDTLSPMNQDSVRHSSSQVLDHLTSYFLQISKTNGVSELNLHLWCVEFGPNTNSTAMSGWVLNDLPVYLFKHGW